MWKCPQLLCHDLSDVVHSSKLMIFEVEFEFWEKEEVTRTQIRQALGLRHHCNTLSGQKFVHGDGSVTGSIVVTQHPSVHNLWPDTMNPFSESFKDLMIVPIILAVKRRSDLTRALTLVTFSSVFDVHGLPEQRSSSTLSRPSKNALCHLKTCALDTACSV